MIGDRFTTRESKDEATEHHGAGALCYDLKVEGGVPFPVFAQASQEFPGLNFSAEWVNVAAGERGSATIVNGRVTGQTSERILTRAGEDHPVYVAVAGSGRLELALTLFRAAREEWRGYALTATRDALLRVRREPESDAVELHATEGGQEWALAWRGTLTSRQFEREVLNTPMEIDSGVYRELDQLARRFAADWIWFASGRPEEIAIEKERYERCGYEIADANVRTSKLHAMRSTQQEAGRIEHSTLAPDEAWVKDVILDCWVEGTAR
ncbi:MAG: hypothetical protein HYU76_00765 [Betaproteobacteria bacterium]|nr:hypothetical protein [Betaproteobacteria bacterium]